ncbi:hypothetical protein TrLO_g5382 [Triparma laevis f. longispina]|uniref:Protein OS9-like domain-containing protein n=1 Tax=Triparma laevis f. longispina TaxID=1714387 RepID=A0A9W6ZM47_9STRA|nr:hypothetical protein TrLO_g5382 [Triparma laevis f. longispina]
MWVKTVNEVEPCSYVIEVCGGEKCVDDSRREVGEAFKILEEEMKGKCLVYSEDWWSYEYCWPGKLKQFHLKGVLENKKVKAVREAVNDISTGRKGGVEVVEGFGRDSGLKEGYGFLRERIEGGSECTEEVRLRVGRGAIRIVRIVRTIDFTYSIVTNTNATITQH